MTDELGALRNLKKKYEGKLRELEDRYEALKDRHISLRNMVGQRMNSEWDDKARNAFAAVLGMIHSLGLGSDHDDD